MLIRRCWTSKTFTSATSFAMSAGPTKIRIWYQRWRLFATQRMNSGTNASNLDHYVSYFALTVTLFWFVTSHMPHGVLKSNWLAFFQVLFWKFHASVEAWYGGVRCMSYILDVTYGFVGTPWKHSWSRLAFGEKLLMMNASSQPGWNSSNGAGKTNGRLSFGSTVDPFVFFPQKKIFQLGLKYSKTK